MSIYKMFGDVTGGVQNDAASVDVQANGDIVAIHGTIYGDLDADQESLVGEVSFLSTNTFTTNDARGSLFIIGGQYNFTTSGGSNSGMNSGVGGLLIPVNQGERIHMHISATSGVTGDFFVYLYVNDTVSTAQRRR